MILGRLLAIGTVGVFLAAGSATAASAASTEGALARAAAAAYPGESYSQWGPGYGRRYYGRRYYRRGPSGGAVAAGVLGGLAVGALAAGALASQPGPAYPGAPIGNVYGRDPNWVNYCASRYRSFDPVSGTFLGRDGNRYPCQ